MPPESSALPPKSWPPNAKAWVAVLAALSLVLAVAAMIGFASGDDPSSIDQDLQAQIESITVERDDLVEQVADLQATIDVTVTERDGLETTLATLTTERDELLATVDAAAEERDVLRASLAAIVTERDDLVAKVGDLNAQVAALTVERDALVEEITDLESDLTVQTQRATAAAASLKAVEALFPIKAAPELGIASAVGDYDVEFDRAYCVGLADCAALPTVDELTIRETPNHWLELVMPGYPTAGLMKLDGVLYGMFDVTTAGSACGTTPRAARVTMTFFARGATVAANGAQDVSGLAASMTLHAPATATCEAGTAVYALQLTPRS